MKKDYDWEEAEDCFTGIADSTPDGLIRKRVNWDFASKWVVPVKRYPDETESSYQELPEGVVPELFNDDPEGVVARWIQANKDSRSDLAT